MAMRVVDVFEVIKIHEKHRKKLIAALAQLNQLLAIGVISARIQHTGQRIVRGQLLQLHVVIAHARKVRHGSIHVSM